MDNIQSGHHAQAGCRDLQVGIRCTNRCPDFARFCRRGAADKNGGDFFLSAVEEALDHEASTLDLPPVEACDQSAVQHAQVDSTEKQACFVSSKCTGCNTLMLHIRCDSVCSKV
eukprot:m.184338 g.184338  ORF g.184338 m.184338 type:complete len:114 (+) comp16666_c0_seq4:2375-2716(+)